MSAFNEEKLVQTLELVNRLYSENSDISAFASDEQGDVMYSENRLVTANPSLTTFLRYKDYFVPALSDHHHERFYTEYSFGSDGKLKFKKMTHESPENCMGFHYVYGGDIQLKLGFRDDTLRYIHVCRSENGLPVQVDNAYFGSCGSLKSLSGELYNYEDGRLASCVKYSEYSPVFEMFMEKKKMGRTSVVNPLVREFHFDYDNSGDLRSFTVQPSGSSCEVDEKSVGYFRKFNAGEDIDQLILW